MEDDFFFFLGVTSAKGFFRFNSAAKYTREILRSPQMVSIPRGVRNLRHMWYVNGTACTEFSHGVPMIALYDAGRSMTKNSMIFVMLSALTEMSIVPRVMVASPKVLLPDSDLPRFRMDWFPFFCGYFWRWYRSSFRYRAISLRYRYYGCSARQQGDRWEVWPDQPFLSPWRRWHHCLFD